MHNHEEVFSKTLAYFSGDTMATNVWIDKYCLKDLDGNLLEITPDDMHKRIAKELSRIEQKYINPLQYEEIYDLLKEFKTIIPGGSVLFGCGNDYAISSLGNCFVIGNNSDSYGGIMATDEEQVQLMKRRGGVGHDISHLRAKSSSVSNSAKTSTGAVSFMSRYSNSCREVAQDGRRGALMLSMSVEHPDIDDFIVSKDDLTKITGANISVKVTDEFMNNKLKSQTWQKLVHQAWKSAEPGILFIDTIQRESPADCYGLSWRSVSTNPCGEIPLCQYDSCRLLSVNLMSCVENPFTPEVSFNFEKLKRYTYIAQRLMDDIVDLEEEKINAILAKISHDNEPDDVKHRETNLWLKIKEKLVQGRRTGLSGIGLADVVASLGIKYDNAKDIAIAIYKTIAIESYRSSIDMAKERGAFPVWNFQTEKDNPFLKRVIGEDGGMILDWSKFGRRNIANLTIPPSGSLSILAGISSGIEPVFRVVYKRRRKVLPDNPNKSFQDKSGDWWEEYSVLHGGYQIWLDIGKKEVNSESPYAGSASDQINPIKKIEMIGGIQQWVDHAISQTLNLPKGTPEKVVSEVYIKAWECGLKGMTVYVDGSRDGVLIVNEPKKQQESFHQHDAPKRPRILPCDVRKVMVSGREWVVCVGLYEGKPFETFAFENKWNFFSKNNFYAGHIRKIKGGQYDLHIPSIVDVEDITGEMTQGEEDRTRMISTSLRHGANVKFVIEQLNKSKNVDITSFSKAIARSLKYYIKDGEKSTDACPKCGGTIIYRDGCKECQDCGDQKCG